MVTMTAASGRADSHESDTALNSQSLIRRHEAMATASGRRGSARQEGHAKFGVVERTVRMTEVELCM